MVAYVSSDINICYSCGNFFTLSLQCGKIFDIPCWGFLRVSSLSVINMIYFRGLLFFCFASGYGKNIAL